MIESLCASIKIGNAEKRYVTKEKILTFEEAVEVELRKSREENAALKQEVITLRQEIAEIKQDYVSMMQVEMYVKGAMTATKESFKSF